MPDRLVVVIFHRCRRTLDVNLRDVPIQLTAGLGHQDVDEQVCVVQVGIGEIRRQGDGIFIMTVSLSKKGYVNTGAVGPGTRFKALLVGSVCLDIPDSDLAQPGSLVIIQYHVQCGRDFLRNIRLNGKGVFSSTVVSI